MARTPGVIIPSSYSSMEELLADLKRRDTEAGFTPLNFETFLHSNEVEEFLAHFGVKGMHWGIRNAHDGISRRTHREARKDAEEFARAKLFFGEGAGTRRKLINKTVEAKKAKDPIYAKAFEQHLMAQDLSKHAQGARKERTSIDRSTRNKKRVGAIARRVTGEWGTQAAFVALAAGGLAFVNSQKGRRIMKTTVDKVSRAAQQRRGAARVLNLLEDMMQ